MASRKRTSPAGTRATDRELVAAFAASANDAKVADEKARKRLARTPLGVAFDVYGSAGDCAVLSLSLAGEDVYLVDWQIDDEAGAELFRGDGTRFAWCEWTPSALREEDLDPSTLEWILGTESAALDRHRR